MANAVQLSDYLGNQHTAANPVSVTIESGGSGGSDASAAKQDEQTEILEDIETALSTDTSAIIGAIDEASPATNADPSGLRGALRYIAALLENQGDVIEVIPVCDTSILAGNDVIFNPIVIPNAVRANAGRCELRSITIFDEDDQGTALDLVFSQVVTNLGTVNSAPNIADADARNIEGFLSIGTGDFIDLGGVRVATIRGVGLEMEAAAGTRSLFVGGICRSGTPTYTASGIRIKLGFVWLT